jgi:hypothetical protein
VIITPITSIRISLEMAANPYVLYNLVKVFEEKFFFRNIEIIIKSVIRAPLMIGNNK